MSENYLIIQVKIQKDIHPEIYEYLSVIRKAGRCEAARMLMQKALNEKALVEKVLQALPFYNMVIAQPQVNQLVQPNNQESQDEPDPKEDLSYLDDIAYDDDFSQINLENANFKTCV
jgi:hypothetical protein